VIFSRQRLTTFQVETLNCWNTWNCWQSSKVRAVVFSRRNTPLSPPKTSTCASATSAPSSATAVKDIDLLGTYCRGGPPWPPSIYTKRMVGRSIPTEGGHGGPPLQYVPQRLILFTRLAQRIKRHDIQIRLHLPGLVADEAREDS